MCLLIGSVGSGKSTFTDYLKIKGLPKDVISSTLWININLNDSPLNREMIYEWVIKSAIDKIHESISEVDFDLLETILEVFQDPISKLKKGRASLYEEGSDKYLDIISEEFGKLQDDQQLYLKELTKYIKNKYNKVLIIVLDNCDKGNRDDQLLMFEVASWIKKQFSCVVFLPIRDTTYDLYKNTPPLDTVIKDLVFRIDPPLLERVIYSRLSYLTRELSLRTSKFAYSLPNGIRVECDKKEVEIYMRSMVASLFKDPFYKRILVGLSGRNIRKGLEIVLDFCKSGHIPEDEILKVRQSEDDYKLPSHLVSKIIMKGKRKYYDDYSSSLKNLFHSYQEDALPDPFVRVNILETLQIKKDKHGPNQTKGFHKTDTIIKELQRSGHTESRIFKEISILIDAGCIYSESQLKEANRDDLISISPSGMIHLELMKNINYLSAISEDTLYRDNQTAKLIKENIIGNGNFQENSRQTSISNAKLLLDYMIDYMNNYALGKVKLLNEPSSKASTYVTDASEHVEKIASQDYQLNEIHKLESLYPIDSVQSAQVVSIQSYGIFLEFGTEGTGFIPKSDLGSIYHDLEEGDWKSVKIVKYNAPNKKFDLSLVL